MNAYTIKEYALSNTTVRYIIMHDAKKVFLQLVPAAADTPPDDTYVSTQKEGQFSDCYDWFAGALCHLHLSHHTLPPYSNSFKFGQAYDDMYFKSQERIDGGGKTTIQTVIGSDEGYEVVHRLTSYAGEGGFEVTCTFVNNTGRPVRLEMLSSVSIDGLSPYCTDDGSEDLAVHMFRSGWATEGKHICRSLPALNMEKAWGSNFPSIKIGSQGSRPTCDFFPYAAVEDTARGVLWGIQLAHNATWQIELSRHGKGLSLSGGLGDSAYGSWFKDVENGGSFTAPTAYAAAVCGDISDLSDVFIKMRDRDIEKYGENGMGIIFNEWCTTWGSPSHEGNLRIAEKLKHSKTKYFVMDAGWYDGTIGDWEYKKDAFPNGLKAYTGQLRAMGLIPGIWMEFECTGKGAKYFGPEYDDLHLKHNGSVIVGTVNKSRLESFWDFRNPEAVALLRRQVIGFLKENGFGYLKVDYNANIGIGCDGAESPGEGLRQHLAAVRDFFQEIKREIPDIIIENCASGGMRLEPSMMAVTAMSSFSDAHECFEFPIIAANLHYLIPPCQSQVWNVLKPEFDQNRFAYTISAGFLGRMCWSGDIAGLSDAQMEELYAAEKMYEEVSGIIRHGKSVIYRTEDLINFRAPKGTQAVIRYSDDSSRALLVYHCFENPARLTVPLSGEWAVQKTLYPAGIRIESDLVIDENKEVFGNVVLLERRRSSI